MGSFCHERVIGASQRRVSVGEIFAASACVLGAMATRCKAAGKHDFSVVRGCCFSQKVSPVAVAVNLETAARTPACTTLAGICSLPRWKCKLDIRSSTPLFWFQTWASAWMEPEKTRKYVILPTNGSAVVFHT